MAAIQRQQTDVETGDTPTDLGKDSQKELADLDLREAASSDASSHVDSNRQSTTIDGELLEALRNGDEIKIKKLHGQKPDVFTVSTPQRNTVLHLASRFRKETAVKEILKIDPALLYVKNLRGETPMHTAATVGDDSVIKLLLELDKVTRKTGAENILGMEDNDGNTPLQNAAKNDHSSVVRLLVAEREEACADIVKNFLGAISRRDFDLMDVIFKAKKEVVDMLDMQQKNSLFQYAAYSGHVEITQLLLEENPSLADQGDRDGQPHLHCAAASGHVEIARVLLEANASLASQVDCDGKTPLHCAAASGHVEIARLLLEAKASLASQGDRDGQTPLHCAAASGHVEIARLLLTENASLAYQGDRDGQTPLLLAVKNGRLNVLRTIFRYCPDATDVLDSGHHNILHLAAQSGYQNIVSFIIESPGMEALINSPDENGNTPLHLASMSSHRAVVKILLRNAKVNINVTNHNNQTPLEVVDISTYPGKILQKEMIMMSNETKVAFRKTALVDSKRDSYQELIKAIRRGDWFKICDLAEREDDDLFIRTSPEGNTVLHIAARYGNWLVVDEILEYDYKKKSFMIYKKNHKGETPLHIAAKYGNAVTVYVLVSHDDMIGRKEGYHLDVEGNTPLHNAVRHGHEISAEILIEHDPDQILATNKAGQSSVSIAIDAKLNYITRMLIQNHCASLDHEGPEQLTLLHSAVISQDHDIMLEILKQKPDLINKPDANGRNPLHYAAASDHVKMARRLSKERPSLVYQSDIKGQTPLHLAAKNGQPNVLKMLLKHYPDAIELTDENGHNVLHIAAQNGNVKVVSFILKLREMVDLVNSRDKNGNTPLHLAARELENHVVYILCKNMNVNIRETNKSGKTALHIVETSTVKGKDIQKHLSTKSLKAAYVDRGLDAEDIKTQDEEPGPEPNKDAEGIKAQDELHGTEAKKKADQENSCLVRIEDIEGESGKGKEMAQTLTVMNTLIATFTFTAAFTIPGGFRSSGDRDEGVAVLGKRTSFRAFVITDTIAMTSSMTAAVIVFWSFWCSKSESFMDALPMAIGLTWIGLVSMILAFVTGLYVVLSDNMVLAIAVSAIGCTLPLIFYVFAPIISLLSNPSANVNPLAFTFSMIKIFLNKPIGWCFRWIRRMLKTKRINISQERINTPEERINKTAATRFILLIIVGGFYYFIKACFIMLSDLCFHCESEETESNDQTPTDTSNGRYLLKSNGNESNDQHPIDPQMNV